MRREAPRGAERRREGEAPRRAHTLDQRPFSEPSSAGDHRRWDREPDFLFPVPVFRPVPVPRPGDHRRWDSYARLFEGLWAGVPVAHVGGNHEARATQTQPGP